MAIDAKTRLKARREAPYHVQIEIGELPPEIKTPSAVPIMGQAVRVFKSDGKLKVGERVNFTVRVFRETDLVPPGSAYLLEDALRHAAYMEAFLNGPPPQFDLVLDERTLLDAPTAEPVMSSTELGGHGETARENAPARSSKWWEFWK